MFIILRGTGGLASPATHSHCPYLNLYMMIGMYNGSDGNHFSWVPVTL